MALPWLAATAVAAAMGGCRDADEVPARTMRYGVFRDLVLYDRGAADGGPFFLDRFETTRADWQAYLDDVGGGPAPWGDELQALQRWLPVVDTSLPEARRYAEWRFCRLPRLDEWQHAATGSGRYVFPWGDRFVAERVNTQELGLDAPTTVGTFESGREWGGAYDLLGNVAEWTESVAPYWFDASMTVASSPGLLLESADTVAATLATARWLVDGVPPPASWLIATRGRDLPRLVVGGHYRSLIDPITPEGENLGLRPGYEGEGRLWERQPDERGETVGVRLAADPAQLLAALLAETRLPRPAELAHLIEFLAIEEYRQVLAPALRRCLREVDRPGPLAAVLREELEP